MIRFITWLGLKRVSLFVAFLVLLPATVATAAVKNWTDGTGFWSGPGNWNGGTVPALNDVVNIVFADGTARTVTYDVAAPSLALLSIDLTGNPVANTSTLLLPSNINLTSGAIIVGGYTGASTTNGRGTMTQSSGTVTTNAGTNYLALAWGTGSTGVYTLSGGALVNNFAEYVGLNGVGTFNQSGGSNTINANLSGFLNLAHNAGSTGTYNLSGTGSLSTATDQNIGNSGTGTFNQTGGTNTISGAGHSLYLGRNTGSVGTYTISGTALLVSDGDVIVGNNGVGTLTIQDQAMVYITNNLSIKSSSAVNFNGGTLRFNTVGGTGGLNQLFYTAGTILLAGNRNFSSDTTMSALFPGLTIPSGKKLAVEGNSTIEGGQLTVDGGEFGSQGLLSVGSTNAGYLKVLNAGKVIASGNASIASSAPGINLVSGAGSSWIIAGDLDIGNGDLTIQNQGLVSVGGAVNFTTSSPYGINLNGGKLRFSTYSDTSRISYTAGTIQVSGDRSIGTDQTIAGFYGSQPNFPTGKQLTVEGTATIAASSLLTLSGGTLSAGTVIVSPGSRMFSNTLPSQVTGATLALAGSTIDATGANLTLGDATKVNGFYGNGTLLVGPRTVTLADANDAVLDSASLVSLGSGGSPGTLNSANGLTLDFGGNITGFGTVSTPNNVFKPLINNGHITSIFAAQKITLTGYVKGVGTFDNVNFTGTFSPGLSPTVLTVGNVAFSPTSTLVMELGGTPPWSGHDHLQSSGALVFDGILQVSLINSFSPAAGQSFNLFDWSSTSGTFDVLQLPTLAGALVWNTTQLYTTGVLSVVTAGLPGDYNNNGVVDAADYVLWRKSNNTGVTLPNDSTPGTDATDYAAWRTHFGQTSGSGSGANANVAVPEPATAMLVILAVVGWCVRRSPTAQNIPITH